MYIGTQGSSGGPPPATGAAQPIKPPGAGEPQGIYAARLDTKTGAIRSLGIMMTLERATWLVTHPHLPVIYSVAEAGAGMDSDIYSLGVDIRSGKLQLIDKVDAGGRDATYLALDAASNTLISANHGSGDVTALPLRADGSVGAFASRQSEYGTGPNPRQKAPAAHGVAVDPAHGYVLVADFGADRIFIYHFDRATRALTPAQPPFEGLPAGSGPRHLAFHPQGGFVFVAAELTGELRSYRWHAQRGRLQLVQSVSPYPVSYVGTKSAAEVAVARDGRFVYLSLRGDQNEIVVYAVDKRAGTLKETQRISSQGKTPWTFAIDPTGHWMLVTNQASDSVAVLKVDPATGELAATGGSLPIPKPVTVTFFPD